MSIPGSGCKRVKGLEYRELGVVWAPRGRWNEMWHRLYICITCRPVERLHLSRNVTEPPERAKNRPIPEAFPCLDPDINMRYRAVERRFCAWSKGLELMLQKPFKRLSIHSQQALLMPGCRCQATNLDFELGGHLGSHLGCQMCGTNTTCFLSLGGQICDTTTPIRV